MNRIAPSKRQAYSICDGELGSDLDSAHSSGCDAQKKLWN
jgi:hypothetical protein